MSWGKGSEDRRCVESSCIVVSMVVCVGGWEGGHRGWDPSSLHSFCADGGLEKCGDSTVHTDLITKLVLRYKKGTK